MTAPSFVDTNVLVYAFDDGEPGKQATAKALLTTEDGPNLVLSAQVLCEFYAAVTRQRDRKLAPSVAADVVAELCRYPIVTIDAPLVRAAIETAQRHQLSFWDAQILEAAATAGCDVLLTEGLTDGSTLRGVTIRNPFT